MSLINSMLAGLEDRQAYLSEGRNTVFEGLSPVNDDNFHKMEQKSPPVIVIILILALLGLVSVQSYRYFTGNNPREMIADAVVVSDYNSGKIASVTTASKDIPAIKAGEQSSEPLTGDEQTALRIDYRLSGVPVAATEPVAEKVDTVVSETVAVKTETVVSELVIEDPVAVVSEPATGKIDTTASVQLATPGQKPSISAIKVDLVNGEVSVVRLALSEQADYRIYELNKPDRVVVEFDKYLQLPDALPMTDSTGVISKIRGHHLNTRSKRTMLVFELAEAGKVQQAEFDDTVAGHELDIKIVPVSMSEQDSPAIMEANAADSELQTGAVVYKQKEGTISRTINQGNPDELLNRGRNFYQKGETRKGLEQISTILEKEPRHIPARTTLVNMLIEQNRINDALDVLSNGIVLLPEQSDWLKLKAQLLVRLNRSNDAIETLVKSGPDINSDPDYYAFLAALLQQQGRNAEAVEYYRDVVKVRSDNGVWWMGLGISLERTGAQAQAMDAYNTAINDRSLSPDIRNYIRNRLSALSGP